MIASPSPADTAAGATGRTIAAAATTAGQAADARPDVEILDVTKRFGEVTAVDRMNLRIAHGEFYSILGPSGCGKTTTLAHDRRLRAADRGRDPPRRQADRRRPAVPPQRQHGLPALRPLPAHGRRPERRLRACASGAWTRRGEAARRRGPRARPAERLRAPADLGDVRRPAAARRPGAGPRQSTDGAPARRTARRARPQAPQGDAARAQGPPARGRDHVRVRDPRPGRGARP